MKNENIKHQTSNILYIITKSVWGGAGKYIFDLATCLSDKFIISVAAGGQGKLAQEIRKSHIPYYEIKSFQRKINILKELLAGFEVLFLLFKLKPDIIHVNSSKAGGIVGAAAWLYKLLTRRKPRLIFTAHGWAFLEDRPKWQLDLIKFLSKLTALFYDKIICVSEFDRQISIKNKIAPSHKLVTVHNGIDVNKLIFLPKEKARKKLLLTANCQLLTTNSQLPTTKIIGTIAEWTRNKGLIYLLEAFKKLQTSNILPLTLILIGSGENPDKEKIYNFIKKHNLKNVYLHQWIPNAASYLKAFDIFVLPSVKEGFPYVILEAMAAEVPIIASKVGGIPEMLSIGNEFTGILVPPKNSQILAEKIIYLLNHSHKAKKMAQIARKKVEKEFTLEKMIDNTLKVYFLSKGRRD